MGQCKAPDAKTARCLYMTASLWWPPPRHYPLATDHSGPVFWIPACAGMTTRRWTHRVNLTGCVDRESEKRKAPRHRGGPNGAQGAQKSLSSTDKTVTPMTRNTPSLMVSFCSISLMSRFNSVLVASSSCFSSALTCSRLAWILSMSCFSSALSFSRLAWTLPGC